jgi:hypothetical protein
VHATRPNSGVYRLRAMRAGPRAVPVSG